jgi:hypothetical protein
MHNTLPMQRIVKRSPQGLFNEQSYGMKLPGALHIIPFGYEAPLCIMKSPA